MAPAEAPGAALGGRSSALHRGVGFLSARSACVSVHHNSILGASTSVNKTSKDSWEMGCTQMHI